MILLIDTSQETGMVALAKDGQVLFSEENNIAKEHAAWLHRAIGRLTVEANINILEIEAVAVIAGPGSYTGLRVGMAAAKGFCYALKIPLITQNSLRVMAESMRSLAEEKNALICPMIDARRNEVFTALYQPSPVIGQPSTVNHQPLSELLPPQALILDKNAFEMQLKEYPVVFFGSGAAKWREMLETPHAIFESQPNIIQAFAKLSSLDFSAGNLADLIYSEPVYLKEFFSY